MYSKLKELAVKLNIEAEVGSAEPFDMAKDCLKDVPFVSTDIYTRLDPHITMSDAKSLVAIAIPYNTLYKKPKDTVLRGNISSGAVGEDYHITAAEKLSIIKEELLKGYDVMCFADTGPLIDREVAIRCGLGYRGKHGGIINDNIGSMFFIGYAITNVPFELWNKKEHKIKSSCGNCERCVKACPTGAITQSGFEYRKCISYITQKPGVLTDKESKSIGVQIYGCDICQKVCIKNNFKYEYSEYAWYDIDKLITISNRDFKDTFGNTAAGWRGKKILQRNAIIALGNMGNRQALDILYKLKNDVRDEISAASQWAIGEIEKG